MRRRPEKPAKKVVTLDLIYDATADLLRAGSAAAMQRLAETEPDLAGHLREGLSRVWRQVARRPPVSTRGLQGPRRELELLVLACVEAVGRGHRNRQQAGDPRPRPKPRGRQETSGRRRPTSQTNDTAEDATVGS